MEKESQLFFFSGFLIATLLFGCFVFKRHYLFICVLCTRSVFVCTTGLDFFFFFFWYPVDCTKSVAFFSSCVVVCFHVSICGYNCVCVCVHAELAE